ncbi:MAG: hypothetical protein KDB23_25410 [Planctomycetales bacterium]|nr:hypothetical protein [Planctomycetales bacterium]
MKRPTFSIASMFALTAIVAAAGLEYRHQVQLQRLAAEARTQKAFQDSLFKRFTTIQQLQAKKADLTALLRTIESQMKMNVRASTSSGVHRFFSEQRAAVEKELSQNEKTFERIKAVMERNERP